MNFVGKSDVTLGMINLNTNFSRFLRINIKKDSFLHNMSIIMSGTAVAQITGFFLMPVVSRLFTNSDFGIYGSFISIVSILSSFVTLQYCQAIMLPPKKEVAIYLFFISCLSSAIITLICVVVIIIIPGSLQQLYKSQSNWLLFLLPVAMFFGGLNQSLQAWSVRVKAFKETALSQIIRPLSSIGTWLLAGVGHIGAIGLVIGSVLGDIIASLNLVKVLQRDLKKLVHSFKWLRIKELSLEFRDFPIFSAPQCFMNAVSQGLPVLLLGHFYGIGIAGFYAFSVKVLQTPMGLVLKALRQVLYQKASETYNSNGDLKYFFLKTTSGLMALALIPSFIMFIWAPQLFSFLFGNVWWDAGVFARWLILWLFMMFCNVPSVLFARILRQQRNMFLFECLVLFTRISVLIIGGVYLSAVNTVMAFSILGLILNTILILWIGILLFFKRVTVLDEDLCN